MIYIEFSNYFELSMNVVISLNYQMDNQINRNTNDWYDYLYSVINTSDIQK